MFVSIGNDTITTDDIKSLEGKTIGVDKDSIMEGMFREWTKMHDIQVEPIELSVPQNEAMEMLKTGKMDAYVNKKVGKRHRGAI